MPDTTTSNVRVVIDGVPVEPARVEVGAYGELIVTLHPKSFTLHVTELTDLFDLDKGYNAERP